MARDRPSPVRQRSLRRALAPSSLRFARAVAVPLVLGLPPLYWVLEAARRASLTPLGRDQGIFQYVAWAVSRGERDYADVRDVNGPLTHMVHRAMLALGGADDHRFRLIDLVVTGLTFALAAACLPGLTGRGRPEPVERVAWGFAGWVVLSGQYLLYGYWDLAQRESFLDWFLLPALGVQLLAQAPPRPGPRGDRRRALLFALSGALGVIPWLGKPTYALFTGVQLLTLLVDPGLRGHRRRALAAFAMGGLAGAAVPLAWLLACGDLGAYLHIQLVDVPAMYRFIWPRAAADILSTPWNASQAIYGFTGGAILLALVVTRELPARVVGVALAPAAALVGILAQAKAFPYHFHPLTACDHLQWLLLVAWLAERARTARRDRALLRLVPMVAAGLVALRVATSMEDSPHIRAVWLVWGAQTPEERRTSEYFAHFPEVDYFPYELRETAAYLADHTAPGDRVQIYGMDPYVLFLAGRLSATPYVYGYDLDADAALAGGTGGAPDEAQRARIEAIRDAHEADLLARLEARPPAAFVFFDGAPLLSYQDATLDFELHCPKAWAWFESRYHEGTAFAHDHVWLRNDVAPGP